MTTTAGNDGVDVKVATAEQLATYTKAQSQLEAFKVPSLYDAKDPNARVFIALFDGTGNDAINDPAHTTNVGLLKRQLEDINSENPNIRGAYKEGPGTQHGVMGTVDGALGVTYNARIEVMYERFQLQADSWLRENPDAKISVVSAGFSRGAEQAAGFSRLVSDRGVQDLQARADTAPPLIKGDTIPQALALFDPVATGTPSLNDRRPSPGVITGFQITAADERRLQFPGTNYVNEGASADGRFLRVIVSGAHSDIGGGYEKNGLSSRNFNMMSQFMNGTLGDNYIKKIEVPADPAMSVIHDSSQHKMYWIKMSERPETSRLDLFGRSMEPMSPAMEKYTKNARVLGTLGTQSEDIKLDTKDSTKPAQTSTAPSSSLSTSSLLDGKTAGDRDMLSMNDSPSSRLLSQIREAPRATTQAKP